MQHDTAVDAMGRAQIDKEVLSALTHQLNQANHGRALKSSDITGLSELMLKDGQYGEILLGSGVSSSKQSHQHMSPMSLAAGSKNLQDQLARSRGI